MYWTPFTKSFKTQNSAPRRSSAKWFVRDGWEGKQEEDSINIEISNSNLKGELTSEINFFGIRFPFV